MCDLRGVSGFFFSCHGRLVCVTVVLRRGLVSSVYGVWCTATPSFEGWVGGFLLSLTWKLAPLDGQSDGGETLGEELRLCGLA